MRGASTVKLKKDVVSANYGSSAPPIVTCTVCVARTRQVA